MSERWGNSAKLLDSIRAFLGQTSHLYLLVALGGFALAVVVSFLSVLPLASDDSPFLGFI